MTICQVAMNSVVLSLSVGAEKEIFFLWPYGRVVGITFKGTMSKIAIGMRIVQGEIRRCTRLNVLCKVAQKGALGK